METSSQTEKERALLKKYLEGTCSTEEETRVENWYQSFSDSPIPAKSVENRVISRAKKVVLKELKAPLSINTRLPAYLRIAAVLALIGTISLMIYLASGSGGKEMQVYNAGNGKQKVITLKDGSVVSLNAMSTLRVWNDFNKKDRVVELTGEAYFEVAKNPKRPFIVRTGVVRTTVLGTGFNVQAYRNETDLTITVAEGKVKVDQDLHQNLQKNITPGILPGSQLVYNKRTKGAKLQTANVEQISAWRKGVLYIDNESISDIAKKLERKYNLKIEVKGPIRSDCRYTLRISDETLAKTLEVLTTVSGITCKLNQQNHLTINTKACK